MALIELGDRPHVICRKCKTPVVCQSEMTNEDKVALALETRSNSIPVLPKSGNIQVDIPRVSASRLQAYTYAQGVMLAPRGWQCAYSVSGGYGYDVSVHPSSGNYGIKESFEFTDGYIAAAEDVAEWADTYFPNIVEQLSPNTVIQLDNGHNWTPNGAYAFPTHKTDQIKYLSDLELTFTTPAHRLGLGSQFFPGGPENDPHPAARDFPIEGFISLSTGLMGGDQALCHLVIYAIALPASLSSLESSILKNAELRPEAKPSTNGDSC